MGIYFKKKNVNIRTSKKTLNERNYVTDYNDPMIEFAGKL